MHALSHAPARFSRPLCAALLFALASCSSSGVREVVLEPDARFAWFQALEGTWMTTEDATDPGVEVRYRLTGGGTVVEETIAPGTDGEMVTMIHPDGAGLVLTHYCAAGNQPRMRAKPAAPREEEAEDLVDFRFTDGTNLGAGEAHMNRVVFRFLSSDHLHATWILVQDGEILETVSMDLVRKLSIGR